MKLNVQILIFYEDNLFIFLNTYKLFNNLQEAFTQSFFHVSSIITSTGFSIGNIDIYPTSCQVLMLCLMVISACSGSTCGGFKVARLLIIAKVIKQEILKTIHPNSIRSITFDKKKVDDSVVRSTCNFMLLYILFLVIAIFVVSFDKVTLFQAINAVFTTFGNVGLCFEISNFANYTILSKLTLSLAMLLGRLEILPLLVLFSGLKK